MNYVKINEKTIKELEKGDLLKFLRDKMYYTIEGVFNEDEATDDSYYYEYNTKNKKRRDDDDYYNYYSFGSFNAHRNSLKSLFECEKENNGKVKFFIYKKDENRK